VSSILITCLVKRFEKRLVSIIFISTVAIAFIFIGPSDALGMHKSMGMMCIGLALLGFTAASALIPIYPDMIDYAKETWGNDVEIIDNITGLYGTGFSLGHISGPYLGA
jgi:hypothetical protein